jgi:hypothetical protein
MLQCHQTARNMCPGRTVPDQIRSARMSWSVLAKCRN